MLVRIFVVFYRIQVEYTLLNQMFYKPFWQPLKRIMSMPPVCIWISICLNQMIGLF